VGKHGKDVRGMGFLLGVELHEPVAKRARDLAQASGLLVGSIGDRILRVAPPLILTEEQALEGAALLGKAVTQAVKDSKKTVKAAPAA